MTTNLISAAAPVAFPADTRIANQSGRPNRGDTHPTRVTLLDDEQLFTTFLDGDESCFAELVERHTGSLFGFLYRYTGNQQLAEDVFQDSFIRIYCKREFFQRGRSFKPWLYRIAINIARDRFRENRRRADLQEKLAVPEKTTPSPATAATSRETGDLIQAALDRLPQMQRQVFVLRQYEHLSYRDISNVLERPLNTVKSDMRRALQGLRELLATLGTDECDSRKVST